MVSIAEAVTLALTTAKIGTDYVMTHKGRQEEGTSEGIKLLGFITGASGRLDFRKAIKRVVTQQCVNIRKILIKFKNYHKYTPCSEQPPAVIL